MRKTESQKTAKQITFSRIPSMHGTIIGNDDYAFCCRWLDLPTPPPSKLNPQEVAISGAKQFLNSGLFFLAEKKPTE
jgi:hypothetical protein